MAQANIQLIEGLRKAAANLRNGAYYAWGHHGGCNCGNLIQVITELSKEEIVSYAHQGAGEWTEIADDYCNITSAPLMFIMSKLEGVGMTPTDFHNLEYLEDRSVLNKLPGGFRWLKRNQREDVIVYMETWANLLEEQLANEVVINWSELKQDLSIPV
ncbi:MAG: hypothetical protein K2P88_17825 [Chitinophagaceae bacterium]|uniref:hypothetical protein n=1 Tax=unclassified Paraflavitalea TaxID=2798305 RepID=UPI003D32F05A|nr:hypothetical protein [Chitinophagaceae bacterium]